MRKSIAALSRAERALVAVAAIGAVWSWVELERSDDVGVGIVGYVGTFFGLGLLGSLARCSAEGTDATVTRLRSLQRYDPMRQQLQALCVPRAAAWLLPLLVAPIMAATLPVAFATAPGDWSIVGVLAMFVGVVAYFGMLLGFLAWMLVLLPLLLLGRTVGRRLRGVSADDNDRFALGLGLLLLSIIVFAVALVLATPDVRGPSSGRKGARFAALFGFGDVTVDPAWLMWVARLALVVIVGSVLLVVRISKPKRRR